MKTLLIISTLILSSICLGQNIIPNKYDVTKYFPRGDMEDFELFEKNLKSKSKSYCDSVTLTGYSLTQEKLKVVEALPTCEEVSQSKNKRISISFRNIYFEIPKKMEVYVLLNNRLVYKQNSFEKFIEFNVPKDLIKGGVNPRILLKFENHIFEFTDIYDHFNMKKFNHLNIFFLNEYHDWWNIETTPTKIKRDK